MKTNTDFLIQELEINANTFKHLFKISDTKQPVWKPAEDKWCLLEIVCHLVDEEILDFRTRVKTALNPSQYDFIPIDPEGWVKSKDYINQEYSSKTKDWVEERVKSIEWLKSLDQPNWDSFLIHSELGEMTAGKFLENWVAHDYIHLRQLVRTKRAYLSHLANEDLSYAGAW